MLAWHIGVIIASGVTLLFILYLIVMEILYRKKNKEVLQAKKKKQSMENELDLPTERSRTSLWGYEIETNTEWEIYAAARYKSDWYHSEIKQEMIDQLEKEKARKEEIRARYNITTAENILAETEPYKMVTPFNIGAWGFSISLVLAAIIAIIGWIGTVGVRKEYRLFKEEGVYLESVIDAGKPLENIGMTNAILRYNSWLADARANKEAYGRCSFYYNIDLDELNYVRVPTKGE